MGSVAAARRFRADTVCIIGAGPSGLAAAKYLRAERSFSRITIFEQRATIGGLWNHVPVTDEPQRDLSVPQTDPHAGLDRPIWENGDANLLAGAGRKERSAFMSPVYDRLETNIPRGLMGFSDLDWDPSASLFPHHTQVLQYLETYAKDVQDLTQLNTQVVSVRRTGDQKWRVQTQQISRESNEAVDEHDFDAVIVASGHFNVPFLPPVTGIGAWNRAYPGRISHAKFYRTPEQFANQKVVIVGNSASGVDISAQVLRVCKHPLIQSQKSESLFLSDASSTKIEKPPIAAYVVEDRAVRFEDGTVESDIDAILYCTGYLYSFPFLDSLDPAVVTTGSRTENLYQHIFYRPHPTLSFLALNQKVIPFPVAEAQSAVVARVLSGRLGLPDDAAMARWEQQTAAEHGSGNAFHVLKFPQDADYINLLHRWAGSADGEHEGESRGRGKPPPCWGEKERWVRERFPMIKKEYQDRGADRIAIRTLEELGFDFDRWQREHAGA